MTTWSQIVRYGKMEERKCVSRPDLATWALEHPFMEGSGAEIYLLWFEQSSFYGQCPCMISFGILQPCETLRLSRAPETDLRETWRPPVTCPHRNFSKLLKLLRASIEAADRVTRSKALTWLLAIVPPEPFGERRKLGLSAPPDTFNSWQVNVEPLMASNGPVKALYSGVRPGSAVHYIYGIVSACRWLWLQSQHAKQNSPAY